MFQNDSNFSIVIFPYFDRAWHEKTKTIKKLISTC